MTEWVRWQLDFGRLRRSQVQTPHEPELFCISSKIFEIFYKTTFLGVKNHEEHESDVKKFLLNEKPFEIEKNLISKGFFEGRNFFNAGFVFLVIFYP